MLVAALVATLGFVAVAVGTRRYGLRLGGTIVVGVLAVYTLKNFSTLPIFVASAALSYAVLWYARRETMIYGRDEFLLAMLAGSVVPAGVLVAAFVLPGPVELELYRSVFVGSLLSGVAAFNVGQVRAEHRRRDLAAGLGLYLGLLVVGAALVGPSTRILAEFTPLVLFARTSDIAVARGAVVDGFVDPPLVGRAAIVGVYLLAAGASEAVRRAFGVHVGTVAIGLLAVYTVSSWRLFAAFAVAFVAVLAAVTVLHRRAIVYGRALLSSAAAMGVVALVPLSVWLGVAAGISAVFAGVLAGLLAYYVHRTPPRERRQQAALGVGAYLAALVVVRGAVDPPPGGVPQAFSAGHAAVGLGLAAVAVAVAWWLRVDQPTDEAVYAASVVDREGS